MINNNLPGLICRRVPVAENLGLMGENMPVEEEDTEATADSDLIVDDDNFDGDDF